MVWSQEVSEYRVYWRAGRYRVGSLCVGWLCWHTDIYETSVYLEAKLTAQRLNDDIRRAVRYADVWKLVE